VAAKGSHDLADADKVIQPIARFMALEICGLTAQDQNQLQGPYA